MSVAFDDFWLNSWSSGQAFSKSLADSVTLSDGIGRSSTKIATDAPVAIDATSKTTIRSVGDSTIVTEVAVKSFALPKADTLATVDSEQQTGDLAEIVHAAKSDVLTIADAQRVMFVPAPQDTVTISDAVNAALAQAALRSQSDTVVVSDQAVVGRGVRLSLSDSFSALDNQQPPSLRAPTLFFNGQDVGTLTLTPIT